MRAFRCATSVLGARLRAKRFGAASLVVMAAFAVHGQSPTLLLDNVRIIDGSGGTPVERGRIVIEGGRISRLGPVDQVPAPSGAETVDLAGRTVLPGLIDSAFPYRGRSETRASSIEQRRHRFRDPGQWEERFTELRRLVEADRLPGPRIFTAGPHIDGEHPAYPRDAVVARDPEEARRLAERNLRQGASALKIYFRLPFESAKAVIGVCEARRVPCTAHLEILDAKDLFEAGSAWRRAHHLSRLRSDGADEGGGVSPGGSGKQRRAARRTLHDVLGARSRRTASAGSVRGASCQEAVARRRRWRCSNGVRIALRRKRRRRTGEGVRCGIRQDEAIDAARRARRRRAWSWAGIRPCRLPDAARRRGESSSLLVESGFYAARGDHRGDQRPRPASSIAATSSGAYARIPGGSDRCSGRRAAGHIRHSDGRASDGAGQWIDVGKYRRLRKEEERGGRRFFSFSSSFFRRRAPDSQSYDPSRRKPFRVTYGAGPSTPVDPLSGSPSIRNDVRSTKPLP